MLTKIKMVAGSAGSGKAVSYDTKILTPDGWILNKDLQINDYVISELGQPIKILEIFDHESLNMFNILFDDGTNVECCEDHLWQVYTSKRLINNSPTVLKTSDLLDNINRVKRESIRSKTFNYYSIPLCKEVSFNQQEVPINAYLLGWLIGDGCFCSNQVSIATWNQDSIEIFNLLKDLVPINVTATLRGVKKNSNVIDIGFSSLIKPLLKELELLGLKSGQKFVPKQYLYNSIEIRKGILAGLLDTDGTVGIVNDCKKKCRFSTSSKQLQLDVVELVRSLGGYATTRECHRELKGVEYTVNIRLPFNPFILSRKATLYDRFAWKFKWVKKIKSIEPMGKKPGRCILVDNPSHLYVVKDYIVTHNTHKLKQEVSTNGLLLTASTGIASVNLSESATTIHSLLRALTGADIVKGIVSGKLFKTYSNIFQDYNGIAIDEAPMLARDYIDALIKSLDVYGGMIGKELELYLTGDIAQLSPINAEPYFKSIYINRFETEFLTTIYRQTNLEFKEALNDLRVGKTQKIKQLLIDNNCFVNEVQSNFLGLTLFSTKAKVEAYNLARLRGISGYEEFTYRGIKTGKVDSSWNSFLDPVILKVGTLVRCITNHTTEEGGSYVANGDMAVVEELYKDIVIINLLRNDKSVAIKRIKKKIINPETNMEEGTITYMPLKLSFACTIHSIQGITTDKLQVSMGSNDTFMGKCSGMAYVALSRNTTVEKIKVIGEVKDFDKCCYIDPEYLRFINNGMGSK